MNDDIPDIPPAELDMAIDEDNKAQGKGPVKRTPEQGVADMQERIRYLTEQRQACLRGTIDTPDERAFRDTILRKIDLDLSEARDRLREYQEQLKGRN